MKNAALNILIVIFIGVLSLLASKTAVAKSGINAIDVVLASPESAVPLPHVNESPIHVPLTENRFATRVLARGVLGDAFLAIHPITNQIYFTEYDYRERYFPRRLFRVPPNADNVYLPKEPALMTMPVLDNYVMYERGMDMDGRGDLYVIPRVISNSMGLIHHFIVRISGQRAGTIPVSGNDQFSSILSVQEPAAALGLNPGDLLILAARYREVNELSNNHVIALRRSGASQYAQETLAEFSIHVGEDFAIGADGLLYFFREASLKISRLNQKRVLEEFLDMEPEVLQPRTRVIFWDAKPQIEYWPADRAFYVLTNGGASLLRVSEDGGEVKELLELGHKLLRINVSPDGNTLYAIYEEEPFPSRSCTIQAINRIEDIPAGANVALMQKGDLDWDGIQDGNDMKTILSKFATPSSAYPVDSLFMDLNRDGRITPQDAQDYWLHYLTAR